MGPPDSALADFYIKIGSKRAAGIVLETSPSRNAFVTFVGDIGLVVSDEEMKLSAEGADRLAMPANLETWLESSVIIKLILEATESFSWEYPNVEFHGHDGTGFRPQMLILLLTYCYATGRYGSQEIESAIGHEPVLSYICAGDSPDAEVLRRFRRLQREMLTWTLALVLARAWDLRKPPGTRPNFQRAADERVEQAIFMDCIARDV